MDSFVVRLGAAAVRPDELALLSSAERARYDDAPVGIRESFLAGRVLLRRLAGEQLGIAPADVPLVAVCPDCGGPHGRPLIEGSDLRVSLTHSVAGPVAVAVWGRAVGVDAEPVSHAERSSAAIRTVAGGEGLADWTRIEAVLKADGRGLRVDPRDVAFDLGGTEPIASVRGSGIRYFIIEPDLDTRLQVTVAIAR